ncbi:MAG: hypothetical protein U0822_03175 [Anaerolineae bacterium]
MPLGIELAAVWLEVLTPGEVAAEIEKCLDFLMNEYSDAGLRRDDAARGLYSSGPGGY